MAMACIPGGLWRLQSWRSLTAVEVLIEHRSWNGKPHWFVWNWLPSAAQGPIWSSYLPVFRRFFSGLWSGRCLSARRTVPTTSSPPRTAAQHARPWDFCAFLPLPVQREGYPPHRRSHTAGTDGWGASTRRSSGRRCAPSQSFQTPWRDGKLLSTCLPASLSLLLLKQSLPHRCSRAPLSSPPELWPACWRSAGSTSLPGKHSAAVKPEVRNAHTTKVSVTLPSLALSELFARFHGAEAVGTAVNAVPASSAFCFACRAFIWSCEATNTRQQQEVRLRAHHADLWRQTPLPFLSVWRCRCWCFGSRSDRPLLYLGTCARTSFSPADKQHCLSTPRWRFAARVTAVVLLLLVLGFEVLY